MSKYKHKDCACGCGEKTWGLYKRGHQPKAPAQEVSGQGLASPALQQGFDSELAESVQPDPTVAPEGPPPYPEHLDRRRWRIATERPTTAPAQPWIKSQCRNCVKPMWTRDPLSTWEHGGICEECEYIMRSEMHDVTRRRFALQRQTLVNPFRPRV